MISGVTVIVRRPVGDGFDRFGNPIKTWFEEVVNNVLVQPGETENLAASRPEGVTVDVTLHFPKSYTNSLEGCVVILPAPWSGAYEIIGAPTPYIDANTPTKWHMPAEAVRAHG